MQATSPASLDSPIALRPTGPQDARSLVRFANMAFGAAWTEAFVRWKYFQNPAGDIFGACAELDGKPAAYYGNIPVRLKLGEQVVTAAQAVDAMVAPEARRRKLFVGLARETYRHMDEAEVALTYAFPNPVSLVAFVERLAWMPVGEVPRYVRLLDPVAAARQSGRNRIAGWVYALWLAASAGLAGFREPAGGAPADLSVISVTAFDERFDAFWREASAGFPIALVRDAEYLNWRYARHPSSQYVILTAQHGDRRLAGYAVLSKRDAASAGVAALTEFLVAPGEEGAGVALLAEALRAARLWQCAQVQCWLLPHHELYRRLLEQFGFVFQPGRRAPGMLRYTTPFIIRPHPLLKFAPDPATLEHWYLSAGDYDYF